MDELISLVLFFTLWLSVLFGAVQFESAATEVQKQKCSKTCDCEVLSYEWNVKSKGCFFFNSCSPSVLSLFVFSLFFPSFLYFVISFCIPLFLSVFPSILYAFYRYHDFPWHMLININHLFTGVCSPKTSPSPLVWNSRWWALSPTYPANCCINWWQVLEAILFSHCVCSFVLKWWLG